MQITYNQFYFLAYCVCSYAENWDRKMAFDMLQLMLLNLGIEVNGRRGKRDFNHAVDCYEKRHPEKKG